MFSSNKKQDAQTKDITKKIKNILKKEGCRNLNTIPPQLLEKMENIFKNEGDLTTYYAIKLAIRQTCVGGQLDSIPVDVITNEYVKLKKYIPAINKSSILSVEYSKKEGGLVITWSNGFTPMNENFILHYGSNSGITKEDIKQGKVDYCDFIEAYERYKEEHPSSTFQDFLFNLFHKTTNTKGVLEKKAGVGVDMYLNKRKKVTPSMELSSEVKIKRTATPSFALKIGTLIKKTFQWFLGLTIGNSGINYYFKEKKAVGIYSFLSGIARVAKKAISVIVGPFSVAWNLASGKISPVFLWPVALIQGIMKVVGDVMNDEQTTYGVWNSIKCVLSHMFSVDEWLQAAWKVLITKPAQTIKEIWYQLPFVSRTFDKQKVASEAKNDLETHAYKLHENMKKEGEFIHALLLASKSERVKKPHFPWYKKTWMFISKNFWPGTKAFFEWGFGVPSLWHHLFTKKPKILHLKYVADSDCLALKNAVYEIGGKTALGSNLIAIVGGSDFNPSNNDYQDKLSKLRTLVKKIKDEKIRKRILALIDKSAGSSILYQKASDAMGTRIVQNAEKEMEVLKRTAYDDFTNLKKQIENTTKKTKVYNDLKKIMDNSDFNPSNNDYQDKLSKLRTLVKKIKDEKIRKRILALIDKSAGSSILYQKASDAIEHLEVEAHQLQGMAKTYHMLNGKGLEKTTGLAQYCRMKAVIALRQNHLVTARRWILTGLTILTDSKKTAEKNLDKGQDLADIKQMATTWGTLLYLLDKDEDLAIQSYGGLIPSLTHFPGISWFVTGSKFRHIMAARTAAALAILKNKKNSAFDKMVARVYLSTKLTMRDTYFSSKNIENAVYDAVNVGSGGVEDLLKQLTRGGTVTPTAQKKEQHTIHKPQQTAQQKKQMRTKPLKSNRERTSVEKMDENSISSALTLVKKRYPLLAQNQIILNSVFFEACSLISHKKTTAIKKISDKQKQIWALKYIKDQKFQVAVNKKINEILQKSGLI